jgi:hypothetical protein
MLMTSMTLPESTRPHGGRGFATFDCAHTTLHRTNVGVPCPRSKWNFGFDDLALPTGNPAHVQYFHPGYLPFFRGPR